MLVLKDNIASANRCSGGNFLLDITSITSGHVAPVILNANAATRTPAIRVKNKDLILRTPLTLRGQNIFEIRGIKRS